jgi:nitrate reductase delta subunit
MSDYESALQSWMPRPAKAAEEPDLFGGAKEDAAQAEAIERVQGWIRTRFKLPPDAVVMVSEVACKLPGCPPLETVAAFWENGQRHHFKMFKRVAEIAFDDLPFAWLKDTMVVAEGFECECC